MVYAGVTSLYLRGYLAYHKHTLQDGTMDHEKEQRITPKQFHYCQEDAHPDQFVLMTSKSRGIWPVPESAARHFLSAS